MCVLVSQSCPTLFATQWTAARQAPLSLGFSRQECWSGFSFSSAEALPNPRIKVCTADGPSEPPDHHAVCLK